MNITEICAKKIKNLRELNNYTQSYVADYLEISQNAYSLIEKGATKITLDRLEALAQLYKLSPAELINEEVMVYNLGNNDTVQSKHSNFPPSLSMLEKQMYQQTISRLEDNIQKLYGLIAQLTEKISVPQTGEIINSSSEAF
jgi:transcriptional regulator with XRE-family HTH domain